MTVIDQNNNPVFNLKKEDFSIYDDKVKQTIESVSREEVPVSFGLVIDTSGSMRSKLQTVSDAAVRQSAIEALGQLKYPAAIDLLISSLNDDNQDVRSAAALTLGQTGAVKSVEPLLALLNNDSDSVRTGVVVALGALGVRRAIEPLEKLLKTEKNENVRQQIEQALQRLRAVQPDKQ